MAKDLQYGDGRAAPGQRGDASVPAVPPGAIVQGHDTRVCHHVQRVRHGEL